MEVGMGTNWQLRGRRTRDRKSQRVWEINDIKCNHAVIENTNNRIPGLVVMTMMISDDALFSTLINPTPANDQRFQNYTQFHLPNHAHMWGPQPIFYVKQPRFDQQHSNHESHDEQHDANRYLHSRLRRLLLNEMGWVRVKLIKRRRELIKRRRGAVVITIIPPQTWFELLIQSIAIHMTKTKTKH